MSHRKLAVQPKPQQGPRKSSRKLWHACCAGISPAERLSTRDREDLVWQLHGKGWSDVQIAEHTRMTTYTTARIRSRLGLAPRKGIRI